MHQIQLLNKFILKLQQEYKKLQFKYFQLVQRNQKLEFLNKRLKLIIKKLKNRDSVISEKINLDLIKTSIPKFKINDIVFYPEKYQKLPFRILKISGISIKNELLYEIHSDYFDLNERYVEENRLKKQN